MGQKPREIPVCFVGGNFLDIYFFAEVHPDGHTIDLYMHESFEKRMPEKMQDRLIKNPPINVCYVHSSIDNSVIAVNLI